MISPLTPKSSSTPSSMRAFCSSASADSVESRTTFFGSASRCIDGSWKPSGRMNDPCCSRSTRAPGFRARGRLHDARLGSARPAGWLAGTHPSSLRRHRAGYRPDAAAYRVERQIVVILVVIKRDGWRRNDTALRGSARCPWMVPCARRARPAPWRGPARSACRTRHR